MVERLPSLLAQAGGVINAIPLLTENDQVRGFRLVARELHDFIVRADLAGSMLPDPEMRRTVHAAQAAAEVALAALLQADNVRALAAIRNAREILQRLPQPLEAKGVTAEVRIT